MPLSASVFVAKAVRERRGAHKSQASPHTNPIETSAKPPTGGTRRQGAHEIGKGQRIAADVEGLGERIDEHGETRRLPWPRQRDQHRA
jgi:hypothetical protein